MKLSTLITTLLVYSGLTGCATQLPSPNEHEAIISFQTQLGDEMLARRLDEQRAEHFNHFRVSQGSHTMELGVVKRGHQESQRRCVATLSYDHFSPNQHYMLVENSLRKEVQIRLVDSAGTTLAQTDKVACL